jgi:hypothetical protein
MSKRMIFGALILALMATSCALFAKYKGEGSEVVASRGLVDYQVSGGLMGVNDHLMILNDGRAVLSSSTGPAKHFRLSAEAFEQVKDVLERAEWPDTGDPQAVAPDTFVYSIDYDGHDVTFVDPAVPESIRSVSAVLNDVIYDSRSR